MPFDDDDDDDDRGMLFGVMPPQHSRVLTSKGLLLSLYMYVWGFMKTSQL